MWFILFLVLSKFYHKEASFFNTDYRSGAFLDERKIKPDVIVFSNDNMAIAGLEELKRRKIKVPNEIAITGFDNILESTFIEPPLSTVEQNLSELREKAIELCYSLISGYEIPKK